MTVKLWDREGQIGAKEMGDQKTPIGKVPSKPRIHQNAWREHGSHRRRTNSARVGRKDGTFPS